jgi:hypothetical protein
LRSEDPDLTQRALRKRTEYTEKRKALLPVNFNETPDGFSGV